MSMMTKENILKEFAEFPRIEQLQLLSEFTITLRHADDSAEPDKFRRELSIENRRGIALALSGAFKSDSKYRTMTKEEDREVVMEYLEDKYR